MDSRINNGICRCCASEGTFKDLATTYHWMGEEEIYAEMLKECFDIQLSAAEDSEQGGICEVCITQLRNASNFKKQVLHTEKQFKKRLQDKLFKSSIVKVEVPGPDDDALESDNDNNDDFSGTEYDVPIKEEEPADEPKPRKRAARATTSRAKKSKTERGETSTKRGQRSGNVEEKLSTNKTQQVNRLVLKDIMRKQKNNVTQILLNSNATPIFNSTGLGYTCSYCRENYMNPSDLKKHTLKTHNDVEKSKLVEKDNWNKFYVKMDITDLQCTICDSAVDDIESLLEHLHSDHDIKIHTDIKNHCLPLKFEGDELKCHKCSSVFHAFKILLEHMNTHCRNYICDVCDAGFINQRKLVSHKKCHELGSGSLDCEVCCKSFDTLHKKNMHVKQVHVLLNLCHKCNICDKKFTTMISKDNHMAAVHGVIKNKAKCVACDKEFANTRSLRVHIKRDHLLERNYQCPDCESNFFTKTELSDHTLKHSKEKNFKCDVCLKRFGRKFNLKQHMRIHTSNKRFKCEYCDQKFAYQCTLKSHLKSKHNDLL
ncbi:zinc finger protein draculin isoform X8 [Amyelois transitella]|uniref:zinc finger protein draculin isoform X8 n=1 Tax=Amyelois transitella TaxID=680683 RepID=UPI0029905BCB|nr:zinc finger protein draculin isoform X8 [Amyelois transitella]